MLGNTGTNHTRAGAISPRHGSAWATCALLAATMWMPQAHAQVAVPDKGHGSISTDYAQALVEDRTDSQGNRGTIGIAHYRTVHLNVDYGFADRWAVSASLPYGSNMAAHTDHDPRIFTDPHGQRFIDDGHYRGGWKDWSVGVRYQWLTAPVLLTPYLRYGAPTHDYQFYGESALGLDQTELDFGITAGGRLPRPWQNVYITGDVSYSVMEKIAITKVNHSTIGLDVGYYFSPLLSARVGWTHRQSYGGLGLPGALFNPDGSLNQDVLLYHDTIRNVSFNEIHAGVDYQLSDRYLLTADIGHTLDGDNENLIKAAFDIGISRSF
ncbi:MAG: hypothetical protein JSS44_07560 [Proteobacteria bacterium]|nr:hypothetical protein [Pseudomonadota bacterium]MBS0465378.1 hypothetical protein [Pseudomonadota bacterium]